MAFNWSGRLNRTAGTDPLRSTTSASYFFEVHVHARASSDQWHVAVPRRDHHGYKVKNQTNGGRVMTAPSNGDPTLRWTAATELGPEAHAALCGRGAPYELVTDDVLGARMEVFAARDENLPVVLVESAARFGDRPFLVYPDETVTFAEAVRRVAAVAAVLSEHYGVGRGDRVAFAGTNHLAYVLGTWATIALGGIAVGVNRWWTRRSCDTASGRLPTVVFADDLRRARLREGGVDDGGVVSFDDLLVAAAEFPTAVLPTVEIAEDDPAIVLFTSGTTAAAKSAVLSHRALVHLGLSNAAARAVAAARDGVPTAVAGRVPAQIMGSPLFHVSGASPVLVTGPPRWHDVGVPAHEPVRSRDRARVDPTTPDHELERRPDQVLAPPRASGRR